MADASVTDPPAMPVRSRLQLDTALDVPATPAASTSARWDVLLVVIVAWTAHFSLFRRFGLYEDDFWVLGDPLAWTWQDAQRWIRLCAFELPQGRPIGLLLGSIVPYLFWQLGGVRALPLVYLAASAFVVLNAFLAHRLLFAVYGRSFALLGALFFALYPPDTTHSFLLHSFALKPALAFVLLALLAYVRGHRVAAYLLAAASLLTYESGMLAFFAAPLLTAKWDRGLLRRWAGHVAIVLAIVGVVVLLRFIAGEPRVANYGGTDLKGNWSEVPYRILQALWMGPRASLATFVKRPGYALHQVVPLHLGLRAAIALPILFAVFYRRLSVPLDRGLLLRAAITGLVMLVGGYGVEFSRYHFPPVEVDSRLSAVHLGATVGAAILAAALVSLLWSAARTKPWRLAAAGATAAYVASLWLFGIAVQKGYARAAEHQRVYWARLVELMPDLSERSLVILIGAQPPASEFILTSSWSDCYVLPRLFHGAGGAVPRLVGGYNPFHEGYFEARDGKLWWTSQAPPWLWVDRTKPVQREDVIVLEHDDAGWHRRVGSIAFHGVTIPLPAPPAGAKIALEKGPLYPLILGPRS